MQVEFASRCGKDGVERWRARVEERRALACERSPAPLKIAGHQTQCARNTPTPLNAQFDRRTLAAACKRGLKFQGYRGVEFWGKGKERRDLQHDDRTCQPDRVRARWPATPLAVRILIRQHVDRSRRPLRPARDTLEPQPPLSLPNSSLFHSSLQAAGRAFLTSR